VVQGSMAHNVCARAGQAVCERVSCPTRMCACVDGCAVRVSKECVHLCMSTCCVLLCTHVCVFVCVYVVKVSFDADTCAPECFQPRCPSQHLPCLGACQPKSFRLHPIPTREVMPVPVLPCLCSTLMLLQLRSTTCCRWVSTTGGFHSFMHAFADAWLSRALSLRFRRCQSPPSWGMGALSSVPAFSHTPAGARSLAQSSALTKVWQA